MLPYLKQLDGLRCMACFGVILLHWLPPTNVLRRLHLPLGDGIFLFFVLSGFLITRILLECRDRADAQVVTKRQMLVFFYIRRALRLFPLYFLVVLVTASLSVTGARDAFPWHLAYCSNVYYFIRGGFNGPTSHFWTLSVEEQFYLIWAILILFVPRKKLFAASLLTISIGPLSSLLAQAFGIPFFAVMTPSCFDTLGLGSLLAISEYGKGLSPFPWAGLTRVCGIVGLPLYAFIVAVRVMWIGPMDFWLETPWGVLHRLSAGLASVWLVSSAATGFRGLPQRILEFPVIAYFGRISYGIYILHNLVPAFISIAIQRSGANVPVGGVWAFFTWAAFTLGLASLSWHFLESPLQRLKRYVRY